MFDQASRSVGRRLARHWLAVVGLVALVVGLTVWVRQGDPDAAGLPQATTAGTTAPSAPGAGRPAAGDLTLARPAGQVLVGLTVRPAQPGPNTLLVYLLPFDGEEAAEALEVTLDVAGQPVSPQQCGAACRQAAAELRGGETIQVTVQAPGGGTSGGTAAFSLPQLPAADGSQLFARAQERMHRLDTVAIVEKFSIDATFPPDGDPSQADYEFQAPDRMRVITGGGAETVIIGAARYRRDAPDQPWDTQEHPLPLASPDYAWDPFLPPVAPTIIGSEDVDGQPTTVVAFAGTGDNIPVWFRLWVDPEGLVRQATMRAQAHFMHHRYHSFDAPFTITPPTS